MNSRQLRDLGIPDTCLSLAIQTIQTAVANEGVKSKSLKGALAECVASPANFVDDPLWGPLAQALAAEAAFVRPEPISYRTWGQEIEGGCHAQMRQACAIPGAVGAALMPDAHIGYGLPIGGVLAIEGAVVPYAVGVDIACRMKLSLLDLSPAELDRQPKRFADALEKGTRFGVGAVHERPQSHPVMDEDWSITRITREHRDKAWKQLGTSGSGNHFVEFGVVTLSEAVLELNVQPGQYLALLSHSGSRGTGAAVCDVYSQIARQRLPKAFEDLGRLAWLTLDSEAGKEYWAAMNLMGEYAAANHAVIHRLVSNLLGAEIVAGVENHHNFAWQETHGGRDVIVHRKGATPAGPGVLGVIPGSMASPAYVVRGKGEPESLHSASHGAGRRMSRTAARDKYNFRAVQKDLAQKGVTVLSAGADEVPYVYKDIEQVMAEQTDLVEVLARFDPRIVKMCGDNSKAED